MSEEKLKFKIVLGGDGAVGKTSLRKKYMGEGFEKEYLQTLGADFALHETKIEDSDIKFQIWDLAGQPLFSKVVKGYYEGCNGAIMVYDVTRPESMDNLKNWIDDLIKHGGKMSVVIIGNKIDLDRVVATEAGLNFATQVASDHGIKTKYIETSALTGENVQKAFETLGQNILESLD
ncbi:MAG: Rab family GTPase [Candidatus Hodarchaeota archaeon]